MKRRNSKKESIAFGGFSTLLNPSLFAGILSRENIDHIKEWGILDVTKPPDKANKTGNEDSTKAIQKAIDDTRDGHMITYFPAGTYLVSDTLILNQQGGNKVREREVKRDGNPCVLWSDNRGDRAKILLSDNAPGFSDQKKPKPFIYSISFKTPTKILQFK